MPRLPCSSRHAAGPSAARAALRALGPAAVVVTILASILVAPFAAPAAAQGTAGAEADAGAPAIAAGGFGRPVRLGALDASAGAAVALAATRDGPVAVFEDDDGIVARPLDGSDAPPERVVASRGVRGLWAGDADGDAVIAWLERDLRDGSQILAWRWRGETREVTRAGQTPLVRVVRDADAPTVVLAVPGADGWRLEAHDWNGVARTAPPRPAGLTVAGLDAVRVPGGVALAWLEGTNDVVLGLLEASWTAWLATWPDGAPVPDAAPLGPSRHVGDADVARVAADPDGGAIAAWPDSGGVLRYGRPGGPAARLGTGRPLGRLDGAWTWIDGEEVRRLDPDAGGAPDVRTVLRLPAAPEHAAAGRGGGVTGIVWSSGRYLGGLEVWGVTDRAPYRAGRLERLALAMGWDPWRPWSSLGGHVLVSLLVAILAASAVTPAWWAAAALAARVGDATTACAARRDGVAIGAGTVVAGVAAVAAAAPANQAAALTGGPVVVAVAAALGAAVAWWVSAGRDLDGTFGRLLVAWAAGGTGLLVVAFATATAWQRLAGAA